MPYVHMLHPHHVYFFILITVTQGPVVLVFNSVIILETMQIYIVTCAFAQSPEPC